MARLVHRSDENLPGRGGNVVSHALPTECVRSAADERNERTGYIDLASNVYCPFNTTSISPLVDQGSGTVAASLGLSALTVVADDTPGEIVTNVEEGMQNVQAIDPNFGEFLTNYNPTNIRSATNYQGGPAMPYGMDRDFQNWVAWQPLGFPVYLSGYGGGALPASFMPGQGN